MTFWRRWRGTGDPIEALAEDLPRFADRRAAELLPELAKRVPALGSAKPESWQCCFTLAVAQLAAFPLLRAVEGDGRRYARLLRTIRTQVRALYPSTDALWARAERSTVPPTGREQRTTLAQVDEAQALALSRWVLVETGDGTGIGARWDGVREVSRVLQEAVGGYWVRSARP
jgi:hypothetical protein